MIFYKMRSVYYPLPGTKTTMAVVINVPPGSGFMDTVLLHAY